MNGNEIVKYHNDLNKIRLPSFTEQEQNMLFGILVKIRENKNTKNSIFFEPHELEEFSDKNCTNRELEIIVNKLKDKFFKADFTIIYPSSIIDRYGKKKETIATATINLFKKFIIHNDKLYDKGSNVNPIADNWYYENYLRKDFEGIELEVNEEFAYLINELTKNFTAFELAEFIALSGKYTKTLYRLLKQFRSTGIARFEWSEFVRILDIPENYRMCDIDTRILKPAIKDLTKERNLFDQKRMPFINLAYEKIKARTEKGMKVIGITFTFKPDNIELEKEKKELAHENKKLATNDNKILSLCNKLIEGAFKFSYQDKTYKALSYDYENYTLSCVELERNESENFAEKTQKVFKAKNKETFLTMLETFVSKIC